MMLNRNGPAVSVLLIDRRSRLVGAGKHHGVGKQMRPTRGLHLLLLLRHCLDEHMCVRPSVRVRGCVHVCTCEHTRARGLCERPCVCTVACEGACAGGVIVPCHLQGVLRCWCVPILCVCVCLCLCLCLCVCVSVYV